MWDIFCSTCSKIVNGVIKHVQQTRNCHIVPTAQNAGPQADKPRKKWRVPRGVYDSYGHIGQPAKQRRGGRRQRRRECNEELAETQHVAKTDGGGWVAVAGEVPDSSSRNAGGADAPRVHAANNVSLLYRSLFGCYEYVVGKLHNGVVKHGTNTLVYVYIIAWRQINRGQETER